MTVVGHVVASWLPRTQTFIHRAIVHQQQVSPVVLAGRLREPREFAFEPVVALAPPAGPMVRLARRAQATAGRATVFQDRLRRAAAEHDCAILHAHFGTVGARCRPVADRLGSPLVTTFYGRDLAAHRSDYPELFARGASFVVEGPAMAEHLHRIGAPRERIRIVEIAVDQDALPAWRPRTRRDRGFTVLQCARFTEKKGVDLSIAAFAQARSELGRDAQLWLIGDGPLRVDLERQARDSGGGNAIRFVGSLAFADYRAKLERADCAIQPSRTAADGDTEGGAPTVLLEYQAAGLPVVATRHADIPYVLPTGDLVDEGDVAALAERLVAVFRRSDDERLARAVEARELVTRRHAAPRIAARLEDLYLELLGADPPARADTGAPRWRARPQVSRPR